MAAGAVAEQVAVELEQVAGDLEQVASVTRSLDGRVIGSLGIGLGIGAVVGFYFGYKYAKKKLRAEIYADAEKDIESVRELYQQKLVALENSDKAPVAEMVQDLGYASEDEEISVAEPQIEYSRLEDPADEPDLGSIPMSRPVVNAAPKTRMPMAQKDKDEDWDWENEYVIREDESEPQIIHQDEFELNESGYAQVTYIYYMGDDVLVDEDDPRTVLNNTDNLVGARALEKFGHGADDYNTVYVRNSHLELEFTIHRVRGSWEEEVMGLDPNESG